MSDFPLIYEKSVPGRKGISVPGAGVSEADPSALLGSSLLAVQPPALPELSENEVLRHFTRLSQRNAGIDTTFYPLGSCTMKHNPRLNEAAARLPGFGRIHPLAPAALAQGALELMAALEDLLCRLTGMDGATLQPAAGAQGEITGLMIIKKALEAAGQGQRDEVLVPDSSHGTNPASGALVGCKVREIKSDARGRVDREDLKRHLSDRTAALMLTNPNTLGLFEDGIKDLAGDVHKAGGLLYCDGANFNALVGRARPGDMGFDVMHLNLHKTFSTPHGGGGPGAGPVAVKKALLPFLPGPRPVRKSSGDHGWQEGGPQSIGRISYFHGNFGNLVRAYAYIRAHGLADLRDLSGDAVLNANYLRARVADFLDIPHPGPCMHEFVASAKTLKEKTGVSALDIAKALIDEGQHPPTIYFPLIVAEALMIEPTETEGLETLENFAGILERIVARAASDAAGLKAAPRLAPVGRLDEVGAARNPDVAFKPQGGAA